MTSKKIVKTSRRELTLVTVTFNPRPAVSSHLGQLSQLLLLLFFLFLGHLLLHLGSHLYSLSGLWQTMKMWVSTQNTDRWKERKRVRENVHSGKAALLKSRGAPFCQRYRELRRAWQSSHWCGPSAGPVRQLLDACPEESCNPGRYWLGWNGSISKDI